MKLESLDGFAALGICEPSSGLTAQQKQVNTIGDMVPLSWLKRNELVSTEKLLTEAGVPFQLKEQPDRTILISVSTPNGQQLLPTIITPEQASTVKSYLTNPPKPSAVTSQTVKPKSNWLTWVLGIGAGVALVKIFSTNKKTGASVGGTPRKVIQIQI